VAGSSETHIVSLMLVSDCLPPHVEVGRGRRDMLVGGCGDEEVVVERHGTGVILHRKNYPLSIPPHRSMVVKVPVPATL
jgi:hypothetical protein